MPPQALGTLSSATMTLHRFLFKFCWRTKLLLPLVFLVCVVAMVMLMSGSHGPLEYTAEGKLRIQYEQNHAEGKDQMWKKSIHFDDPEGKERADPGLVHDPLRDGEEHLQPDKYLNPNLQNALLFRANLTKGYETDPLLHQPLLDKVVHKKKVKEGRDTVGKKRSKIKVSPGRFSGLFHNPKDPPETFGIWKESLDAMCEGNFQAYLNEFAVLRDVVIEKKYCQSPRKGGEFLEDVVNQPEEIEYFTYEIGCFQISKCSERPTYFFNGKNHLNDYMMGVQTHKIDLRDINTVVKQFTIAVTRYEYANIYHTMTDWYNAFMMMQFFNKTQAETNILIVDAHPRGVLDPVWPVLFNSVTRLSYLPPKTLFSKMAWSPVGYNSPLLSHYNPDLALAEEFRTFFLSSYRINTRHRLDCDKLKVLFVWRRDYVAHPRNPRGTVSRKIQNEREIIGSLQRKYRSFHIMGVQIDLFDMQQQLRFVAAADVLVGMHGAGLTHALFLPQHAALIELIPNYWYAYNDHFSAITSWRRLHYQRWVNEDPHNEAPNFYTNIPPTIINVLLRNAIGAMCSNNRTSNKTKASPTRDSHPEMQPKVLQEQGDLDLQLNHNVNIPAAETGKPKAPQNQAKKLDSYAQPKKSGSNPREFEPNPVLIENNQREPIREQVKEPKYRLIVERGENVVHVNQQPVVRLSDHKQKNQSEKTPVEEKVIPQGNNNIARLEFHSKQTALPDAFLKQNAVDNEPVKTDRETNEQNDQKDFLNYDKNQAVERILKVPQLSMKRDKSQLRSDLNRQPVQDLVWKPVTPKHKQKSHYLQSQAVVAQSALAGAAAPESKPALVQPALVHQNKSKWDYLQNLEARKHLNLPQSDLGIVNKRQLRHTDDRVEMKQDLEGNGSPQWQPAAQQKSPTISKYKLVQKELAFGDTQVKLESNLGKPSESLGAVKLSRMQQQTGDFAGRKQEQRLPAFHQLHKQPHGVPLSQQGAALLGVKSHLSNQPPELKRPGGQVGTGSLQHRDQRAPMAQPQSANVKERGHKAKEFQLKDLDTVAHQPLNRDSQGSLHLNSAADLVPPQRESQQGRLARPHSARLKERHSKLSDFHAAVKHKVVNEQVDLDNHINPVVMEQHDSKRRLERPLVRHSNDLDPALVRNSIDNNQRNTNLKFSNNRVLDEHGDGLRKEIAGDRQPELGKHSR